MAAAVFAQGAAGSSTVTTCSASRMFYVGARLEPPTASISLLTSQEESTCLWACKDANNASPTGPIGRANGTAWMFQVVFAVLALVAASIHLGVSSSRRTSKAATYLLYLLVIYVGMMGLLSAYAQVFRPAQTSASIGWSTSPYEYEVGMADLTVGVLGIFCLWLRGNFWLATAIANAVWLLGDAVGHIRQMVLNLNHAANNSGIFLITEITMPFVILVLAIYVHMKSRDAASE
jgi:hypothetical protein